MIYAVLESFVRKTFIWYKCRNRVSKMDIILGHFFIFTRFASSKNTLLYL